MSTGCCPNKNSFEWSLKRLLRINLGEAEDQRFELFEPEGRVFKSPGASLRFIKKGFRPSEKGFGQQPVDKGRAATGNLPYVLQEVFHNEIFLSRY